MDVTEEWRLIPKTERYEASSFGRIRRDGEIILGHMATGGYRKTRILFDGKWRHVNFHRLIMLSFRGECPIGMVVDHIDCNRDNNRLDNLRYLDAAENVRRPFRIGRGPVGDRHGRNTKPECSARGERVGTSKLTVADIHSIRAMRSDGLFLNQIAERIGISKSQVFNVVNNRSWRHV